MAKYKHTYTYIQYIIFNGCIIQYIIFNMISRVYAKVSTDNEYIIGRAAHLVTCVMKMLPPTMVTHLDMR